MLYTETNYKYVYFFRSTQNSAEHRLLWSTFKLTILESFKVSFWPYSIRQEQLWPQKWKRKHAEWIFLEKGI